MPKVQRPAPNAHWGSRTTEQPKHAARVTLVNMEARKASARHARPGTFKTPKKNHRAKHAPSTRTSPKKANRQKRIVKCVPRKNQLECTKQPRMQHLVCAKGPSFTRALKEIACPARMVPIVRPTMDSIFPSSRPNRGFGGQAWTVISFHLVSRGTVH